MSENVNYKECILIFIVIINSIWSVSANTTGDTIFGPIIYKRAISSPDISVNNFSVSYSEGNFTLHLRNGENDSHKINSATIMLNGEIIVKQNEFNQTIDCINKSIKLKPYNNLQVQLNSKPGGFITLYIQNQHTAPTVKINFPIDNAYHPVNIPLDGSPIILKTAVIGTIKGNVTNATLRVNNESYQIPVTNGSFYQNVSLTEGANRINVFAVDEFGNIGNAGIDAYVENTNAELRIPVPPPNPFEDEKLGAGLNYTAYLYKTQGIDAAASFISLNPNNIIDNSSIRVRVVIPEENVTYIKTLKSMGIDVLYVTNAKDIGGEISVDALLPLSKIHEIKELQFVKGIYVESKPSLESITEGDAIMGSDKTRGLGFTGLKQDGSPVKVAVIDAPGSQHEAKVMDIIRSIAPAAQIMNYSGDWKKGINDAVMDKVDIISVSLSAPNLELDGTDSLSKVIKIARTNDTFYVNAASNYANLHYNGTYQDKNRNGWHEFAQYSGGYDETLNAEWSFLLNSTVTAYLHVNPADADKLDIKAGISNTELLNLDSSIVMATKGVRRITASPGTFSDVRFFVVNSSKYNSSDVIGTPFHIFVYPDSEKLDKQHQWIDHPVQESSIPAPATSKYSFTVGATYSNTIESYADKVAYLASVNGIKFNPITPVLMTILSSLAIKQSFPQDGLAYFSGQGPVYDAAGNTITKPDIVAPTFVSTDHGIFGGTSASAPHVAGAAALLLSANPNLTADQLQQVLEESAVDLGETGKDNKYGAGRIDVYEAVRKVTPDLQPSGIQVISEAAAKGQNIAIRANINNIGYWDAQNVEVQFLENGTIINTTVLPVLKNRSTAVTEVTWVPANVEPYNISVNVDSGNKIPEFNESNNRLNRTVTVDYRKKLTIGGTTAGAQTNYQMKLTVYKGSGTDAPGNIYLGSSIRDDFSDIRFTKSDGTTPLDYWIESYTPGISAVIWIEMDYIPASPNTVDIYIYYDYTSASSLSSGANTFIFFDDFIGTGLDGSKWNIAPSTGANIGTISVVSGTLFMEARCRDCATGGSSKKIYTKSAFIPPVVAEWKAIYSHTPRDRGRESWSGLNDYPDVSWGGGSNFVELYLREHSHSYADIPMDSVLSTESRGSVSEVFWTEDNYYKNSYNVYSVTAAPNQSTLAINYINRVSSTNAPTAPMYGALEVNTWIGDPGYEYYMNIAVDWFRVRKYADPEPTWR